MGEAEWSGGRTQSAVQEQAGIKASEPWQPAGVQSAAGLGRTGPCREGGLGAGACVSRAQCSTHLHGGRSCWNPRKSPFLNVPPAPSTQRLSISAGRNASGALVIAEKALKAVEREVGNWHKGPLWGRLSLFLGLQGPLVFVQSRPLCEASPSRLLQDRDQGPRVQRNLPKLLYFFSLFPFLSIIQILYFLDCLSTFVIFSSFLWIFLL